ncbi:MAG: HAD family hydrolase [Eubacteriales bacterium]|nr:HAD family hydrolase [Eubacteriales bacterium]
MINKNIKLVALDMDGTLLDSQNRQPEDFVSWVEAHQDIQTVIASGRQYYTLKEMFPSIFDKLIFAAENGAIAFKNDKMLYSSDIGYADLKWCVDYFEQDKAAHVIICGSKAAYMKHNTKKVEDVCGIYYRKLEFVDSLYDILETDSMIKLAIYYENAKVKEAYDKITELPKSLELVISGKNWMDISNKGVSKGTAIEELQKSMGIKREESMAFGDYLNDYTMLKSCEESYAMANAQPELKEIAKYITSSNDEDGVMKILRQL